MKFICPLLALALGYEAANVERHTPRLVRESGTEDAGGHRYQVAVEANAGTGMVRSDGRLLEMADAEDGDSLLEMTAECPDVLIGLQSQLTQNEVRGNTFEIVGQDWRFWRSKGLGEGGFGKVYKAKRVKDIDGNSCKDPKRYAWKSFHIDEQDFQKEVVQRDIDRTKTVAGMNIPYCCTPIDIHPAVIKHAYAGPLSAKRQDNAMGYVVPLMDGDLDDFILDKESGLGFVNLTRPQQINFMKTMLYQVYWALMSFQAAGYQHMDLKLPNILFKYNYERMAANKKDGTDFSPIDCYLTDFDGTSPFLSIDADMAFSEKWSDRTFSSSEEQGGHIVLPNMDLYALRKMFRVFQDRGRFRVDELGVDFDSKPNIRRCRKRDGLKEKHGEGCIDRLQVFRSIMDNFDDASLGTLPRVLTDKEKSDILAMVDVKIELANAMYDYAEDEVLALISEKQAPCHKGVAKHRGCTVRNMIRHLKAEDKEFKKDLDNLVVYGSD